ncbi:MAG: CoA transferase, partial [Chloroflexota bacterium]
MGPLEGIRIIAWSTWQQGPAATAILGDFGAEVIKIEERT